MRKRALGGLAVTALCLAWIAGPVTPAEASTSYPVVYNSAVAAAVAVANPGGSPPAANDWSCRPDAAHPRPVVLVHGTFANMAISWNALSPLLKNDGYCVFALNFGGLVAGQIGGTRDIAASAGELGDFVDRVLSATGATTVDIVGHSQGGMMPRYYLALLGGAARVANLVALAPSNHGTTLGAWPPWARCSRGRFRSSGWPARPARSRWRARRSSRPSTGTATPCPACTTPSSRPSTTRSSPRIRRHS